MKKLLFLLLFPVSVFSQTLQEVDFVAKGYYKVIVSDTLYSQHQNQKECLQQITNLAINNISAHCEQPWVDVVAEYAESVMDSVVYDTVNVESLTLRQVNWSHADINGQNYLSYKAEAYGDSVRFEYFQNANLIRSSTQIPANGDVHDTLINPPNDSLQIWIYGYWDKWVEPFHEIVDIALLDTLGEEPSPDPEPDPEPEQPDTTMSTYLHDTFTDTDGTSLTAHTPDTAPGGASWDIFTGGVADIQSNQASVEASGTRAAIDAGVAGTAASPIEFLFEWTPTAGEDNRTWCPFRYQDSNNYWGVNAREPNGDVRVIETIGGVSQSPDHTFNYTFTEGQTYEFKVVLEDDSITIFIDGVQELTFTDSQLQSATGYGVGNANVSTPQLFDRIAVVDENDGWPGGGETISPDSLTQSQVLSSPNVSVAYTLSPNGIVQGQVLSSPDVSVNYDVSPDGLLQGQQLSQPDVSVAYTVTPDTLTQIQSLSTPDVNTGIIITPAGLTQSQSLASPTIDPVYVLSPETLTQGQQLSQADLQTFYEIVANSITQSQQLSIPDVNVGFFITPDNLTQAQSLDQADIEPVYIFTPDQLTQSQELSDVILGVIGKATKFNTTVEPLYDISTSTEKLYAISTTTKKLYIIETTIKPIIDG